jgi:D-3-phosphoglycerate dehydrogenase / 2-oxoglutarate reductase
MRPIVAAIDHRFPDLELERAVLEPLGAEMTDARGMSRPETLAACAAADAMMVGARFQVDGEALAALARCRIVVRYGVGVDNVDVAAATRAGVWVACVPDYCIEEVADHALALLLALNRRTHAFDTSVRDGHWGIPPGLPVHRLSTRTLGVAGFGRIGEALGRRAAALGLTVLAYDPARDPAEVRAAGADPVEFDALLEVSDYVSLHMPGSADGPVLDPRRIALMKPGAALINVARGGLVDEAALIEALRSGPLSGAALDVAAAEPLTPPNPLLEAANVIVTPHAAWYSLEAVGDLRTKAAEEVARVLRDESPLHAVNAPASSALR